MSKRTREKYLRAISALPSSENNQESVQLLTHWRGGDRVAGKLLQNTVTKIAVSMALKRAEGDEDIDEPTLDALINEAVKVGLGLLPTWIPSEGALSTRVGINIQFALQHYIAEQDNAGVGDHQVDPRHVYISDEAAGGDTDDEGDEFTYDSVISYGDDAPSGYVPPEDQSTQDMRNALIEEALTTLTPWQEMVVRQTYGLGCRTQTQEEMAEARAVTQQKIAVALKRGLEKLRRQGCNLSDFRHTTHISPSNRKRLALKGDDALWDSDVRKAQRAAFAALQERCGYPAEARPGTLGLGGLGMTDMEFRRRDKRK